MKKYIIITAMLILPIIGFCQQKTDQQKQMPNLTFQPQYKNPAAACVLSGFMPGLGQMYNDEVAKGFCFLGTFYGCILAGAAWSFIFIDDEFFQLIGVASFGLCAVTSWLWSAIDAPLTANRLNKNHGFVVSASPTILMNNNLVLSTPNVVAPGLSLNITF